jgi:predicted GNAT family N-acyltransferase
MIIKLIDTGTPEYENMVELRMTVLLDPVGIPRSYINPEKEKEDILIGAFENDQLIGCCILTKIDDYIIQLKQMAVYTHLQQKGIGSLIVAFAEEKAWKKHCSTLMLHARDKVVDFYKKCGYQIAGERFAEVGIDHYRMEKNLTQINNGCSK